MTRCTKTDPSSFEGVNCLTPRSGEEGTALSTASQGAWQDRWVGIKQPFLFLGQEFTRRPLHSAGILGTMFGLSLAFPRFGKVLYLFGGLMTGYAAGTLIGHEMAATSAQFEGERTEHLKKSGEAIGQLFLGLVGAVFGFPRTGTNVDEAALITSRAATLLGLLDDPIVIANAYAQGAGKGPIKNSH